ncbi:MAG: hypothetical protein HIU57_04885 [Acidobacteria bacterium]|nr:hypothetical protein [Acidobacteriota bacterium]
MTSLRRSTSVALGVVLLAALTAAPVGAAGILPPHEPTADVAASPAFNTVAGRMYDVGSSLPPCWRWLANKLVAAAGSPLCLRAEVRATNHAHGLEHVVSVTLPRNFVALTDSEQLLVLVDLERVSRGEAPVLGLSRAADAMAQKGAQLNQDPILSDPRAIPGATGGWTANWAAAVNPLDANYSWMYLDGWAGQGKTFNYLCTSAHARGCWGHRNDILVNASQLPCYATSCSLVMGAGNVNKHWSIYNSYTELIVQVAGNAPALLYTWKQALAAGARA